MGLLQRRGVEVDGRLQLYHQIDAVSANTYGLFLEIDPHRDWLKQSHLEPASGAITHDVTWEMPKLRKALAEKHGETFWVGAKTRGRADDEEFHYVSVEHTKEPRIRNFDALIEGGAITVDYLLHLRENGRPRDHGYLFKIHPNNLAALFPPSTQYSLAA